MKRVTHHVYTYYSFALLIVVLAALWSFVARASGAEWEPIVSLSSSRAAAAPPVDQPEQVRRAPTTPQPDLVDGDYWLCSVGQSPAVNAAAFKRAKAKGWGFWSFAPHRRLPAGVYLSIVSGGILRDTKGDPWSDDPSPGSPLMNHVAEPTPQPVSLLSSAPVASSGFPTANVQYIRQQPSSGVVYVRSASPGYSSASTCLTGECGFSAGDCTAGNCGGSGFIEGSPVYSGGTSGWQSSSGPWIGGGRIMRSFFGGACGGGSGGCASCGS